MQFLYTQEVEYFLSNHNMQLTHSEYYDTGLIICHFCIEDAGSDEKFLNLSDVCINMCDGVPLVTPLLHYIFALIVVVSSVCIQFCLFVTYYVHYFINSKDGKIGSVSILNRKMAFSMCVWFTNIYNLVYKYSNIWLTRK